MSPGDALRFQWHHFRLMGTRQLREDTSWLKLPFRPESFCPIQKQYFRILISKCPPGMFCGSNDTIFASWGPVCSEKTPPDENHHLSKFTMSYIHATFSNINIQMYPGDVLRFQWHHFRIMGTHLLREDPSRRKPPFVQLHCVTHTHNIFKY